MLAFSHESTRLCQIPASLFSDDSQLAPASFPSFVDLDAVDSVSEL
jgi:hypothetical protein